MKKLTILALVATLALAGSAFASGNSLVAQPDATFLITAPGMGPATTNNDDSCDIGVAPAATLLLPYFEVDITTPRGLNNVTTLFTVTNTSPRPQIAHVTVWTDWSFPVLDFNIWLTGYDVQALDLYDIIARGVVAGSGAESSAPVGTLSFGPRSTNGGNPNLQTGAAAACAALPGNLPPDLVRAVQTALTTGLYNPGVAGVDCGSARVGGTHARAIGYVTIDVANTCSTEFPTSTTYQTTELLFDNVLIGDYQQVDPGNNFAGGNPLVHIRAIPEGGPAGALVPPTNLPYTFYDRYQTGATPRRIDRRQPLPATFAARWIEGGSTGFTTTYKIWREGVTTGTACGAAINNSALDVSAIVRFDEAENPFGFGTSDICSPCDTGVLPTFPETSRVSVADARSFPTVTSGDVAGWTYLDLDNNAGAGAASPYSFNGVAGANRPSQNWVIVSMGAEGRYAVDFDAAWLGNGCSPSESEAMTQGSIGPAGGTPVCPLGTNVNCTNAAFTGNTNTTP